MAQRRMFSKSITNSSDFLMMPQSAQNLYFHFGMNADDDGFCEIFTIMRMTESKPDDLKILQAKKFIHVFDDKVLVIMDWRENNYIQKDRYSPSKYIAIYKKEIKALSEGDCKGNKCIQDVYRTDTQVRLGQGRVGKDINTDNNNDSPEFEKINYNEKDVELTNLLFQLIKTNYSFLKDKDESQTKKDCEEMNKINRLDGYNYEVIEEVIKWCQQDSFWKQNIRSVGKLREKFEELLVKIKGKIDGKVKFVQ